MTTAAALTVAAEADHLPAMPVRYQPLALQIVTGLLQLLVMQQEELQQMKAACGGFKCSWLEQTVLCSTLHRSLTASVKTYESVMADGKGWLLHEGVRQTAGQLVPHAEAAVAEAQAAVIAAAAAGIPDVNQHGKQLCQSLLTSVVGIFVVPVLPAQLYTICSIHTH